MPPGTCCAAPTATAARCRQSSLVLSAAFAAVPAVARLLVELLALLLDSAIDCRVCEAQRSTLRDEAARRAQFSGEYAHILPRALQLGMDQPLPDVVAYGHDFVSALPLVECCDGAECDSAREAVGAEVDRALVGRRVCACRSDCNAGVRGVLRGRSRVRAA